jgi:hypothetical protein
MKMKSLLIGISLISAPSFALGFAESVQDQISQFSRGRSQSPRRYVSVKPVRHQPVVSIQIGDRSRDWSRSYRYRSYPNRYVRSEWHSSVSIPVYRPIYTPGYRPRTRVNHRLSIDSSPVVISQNSPDGACVEFAQGRYRNVYSSTTAMEEAIRGCRELAIYGSSDREEALSCLQYSYDIRTEVHGAATSMDKAFEDCRS